MPFEFHIASNFQYGDYASQTDMNDYNTAMKILSDNPAHFFIHQRAGTEFYRNAHILLLPTLDDTFGLAVLEAQANHCPVLSTDVFAMPEINNNEIGWLLETPKDEMRLGKVWEKNDRILFSKLVCDQLESVLQTLFDNPEMILQKSILAYKQVVEQHNQTIILNKHQLLYNQFKI